MTARETLRALAEAARDETQWFHVDDTYSALLFLGNTETAVTLERAELIAACSPDAVLGLLDALAEAERERDVQYDRANRAVRSAIANRDGRKAAEAVVERQRTRLADIAKFARSIYPPTESLLTVIALAADAVSGGESAEREPNDLAHFGTNALVAELQERGDLWFAVMEYERLYGEREDRAVSGGKSAEPPGGGESGERRPETT